MQNTTNTNDKNIIVGPDYGQMIKHQTNGAIVEAFIALLFSKDTKFNKWTLWIMVRNIAILLFVKIILEESKTYLDKFKFTNLNYIRYIWQRIKFSEKRFEINLTDGKWCHEESNISINNITPFLESKSIFLSQPNTYYYQYQSHLIKVIIKSDAIIFAVPKIESVTRYINFEIITKYREFLHAGRTTMHKVTMTGVGMIKFDPMELIYAFPTENYTELQKSIQTHFTIDMLVKGANVPLCINFDGVPGTGKTTFGSFISDKGIFDRIILFNFVQSFESNFVSIMQSLDRQLTQSAPKDRKIDDKSETVLLIFDEVDKWLESYTSRKIDTCREEARSKKEVKAGEKTESVAIESFTKLSVEEECDKRLSIKEEFLDNLFRLVEGNLLSSARQYVIIFNTNNFDALFEANKRFAALKDRFQRYKFVENNKSEIIQNINGIRNHIQTGLDTRNFKPTERKNFEKVFAPILEVNESVYDDIPDDISMSYRTLIKILRINSYNIKTSIVNMITIHKEKMMIENNVDKEELSKKKVTFDDTENIKII